MRVCVCACACVCVCVCSPQQMTSVESKITGSNVGHQLLKKMGEGSSWYLSVILIHVHVCGSECLKGVCVV